MVTAGIAKYIASRKDTSETSWKSGIGVQILSRAGQLLVQERNFNMKVKKIKILFSKLIRFTLLNSTGWPKC